MMRPMHTADAILDNVQCIVTIPHEKSGRWSTVGGAYEDGIILVRMPSDSGDWAVVIQDHAVEATHDMLNAINRATHLRRVPVQCDFQTSLLPIFTWLPHVAVSVKVTDWAQRCLQDVRHTLSSREIRRTIC